MALAAAAATVLLALVVAGAASAATFTVSTGTDPTPDGCAPGNCSLREAILQANGNSGDDEIAFAGAMTVTLNGPLPLVTEKLSIDGAGTVAVTGSGSYPAACVPANFAFSATAPLAITSLPIYGVCGRAVSSSTAAPTLQVGPRRADNTVSISGQAAAGTVEIYRADAPAQSGEAFSSFATGVASSGSYSYALFPLPAAGSKFAASVTTPAGATSTFSSPATTPADLDSPILQRAVAIANNTVRLDFNESISAGLIGQTAAFSLSMGGAGREITNVGVNGTSIYLTTLTTPWNTGEAGSISLTGNGRVTDVAGNELIGQPSATVYAGPGELAAPVVSKAKINPGRFCQAQTRKCSKRTQTYIYFSLNKPSRVVFTVMRAKGRKFVVRYVNRLEKGQIKSRIRGTVNGRKLPATNLIVRVVAEDAARNYSAPVEVPFKVVTRNGQL